MRLKLLISNIQEEYVVLVSEDKLSLTWLKNKLPSDIKIGQFVYFEINSQSDLLLLCKQKKLEPVTTVAMINQILQS